MKKIILSILAIAMVFSFAACGKSYKMKKMAKKECECMKLKKKARKSDSEKKMREAEKCEYELEAMEADFNLTYFDEMQKISEKVAKKGKDAVPEEWEELNEKYEEILDDCKDDDDDDDDD